MSRTKQKKKATLTGLRGVEMHDIIRAASSMGLWVLIEPAKERGTFKWTVYDKRTGRVSATFWPANMGYVTPASDLGRTATQFQDVLDAARHYLDSFPRTPTSG